VVGAAVVVGPALDEAVVGCWVVAARVVGDPAVDPEVPADAEVAVGAAPVRPGVAPSDEQAGSSSVTVSTTATQEPNRWTT